MQAANRDERFRNVGHRAQKELSKTQKQRFSAVFHVFFAFFLVRTAQKRNFVPEIGEKTPHTPSKNLN
jgi:hypothetical protein